MFPCIYTGNLLTASFGGACGWTSVNFLLLQSDESPLASGKLTLSEASWVVACLTFGGLWGNIVFGYIAEHFGRKWPLILVAIPQIVWGFYICLIIIIVKKIISILFTLWLACSLFYFHSIACRNVTGMKMPACKHPTENRLLVRLSTEKIWFYCHFTYQICY